MLKKPKQNVLTSGKCKMCATHVEISVQHNSSNLSNEKPVYSRVHVRSMKYEQELINVTYTFINEGQ